MCQKLQKVRLNLLKLSRENCRSFFRTLCKLHEKGHSINIFFTPSVDVGAGQSPVPIWPTTIDVVIQ